MIYEISQSIVYLKEAGIHQGIIVVIVIVLFFLATLLCENFIGGVVKIITSFLEFNKEKKYYKLVNNHMCWYRNRARELIKSGAVDKAMQYMDNSIHDLYEVLENVPTKSEQPISGKTGQTVDRHSTTKQQSHGEITD